MTVVMHRIGTLVMTTSEFEKACQQFRQDYGLIRRTTATELDSFSKDIEVLVAPEGVTFSMWHAHVNGDTANDTLLRTKINQAFEAQELTYHYYHIKKGFTRFQEGQDAEIEITRRISALRIQYEMDKFNRRTKPPRA